MAVTNASPATIRRDLIKLDEQGVISRTHGGVTLNRFIPPNRLPMRKCSAAWREKCHRQRSGVNIKAGIRRLDAGTTMIERSGRLHYLPRDHKRPAYRAFFWLNSSKLK